MPLEWPVRAGFWPLFWKTQNLSVHFTWVIHWLTNRWLDFVLYTRVIKCNDNVISIRYKLLQAQSWKIIPMITMYELNSWNFLHYNLFWLLPGFPLVREKSGEKVVREKSGNFISKNEWEPLGSILLFFGCPKYLINSIHFACLVFTISCRISVLDVLVKEFKSKLH